MNRDLHKEAICLLYCKINRLVLLKSLLLPLLHFPFSCIPNEYNSMSFYKQFGLWFCTNNIEGLWNNTTHGSAVATQEQRSRRIQHLSKHDPTIYKKKTGNLFHSPSFQKPEYSTVLLRTLFTGSSKKKDRI